MDFYSVTIKATPWKVRDLAQLKKDGKLFLPDLQRGFVWSSERVQLGGLFFDLISQGLFR